VHQSRPTAEDKLNWKPNAPLFADRLDAGRQLGEELRLRGYADDPVRVLAIPRGGVPVGYAVVQALDASLEIIVPRRLLVPNDPETGFGAITPDGALLLNLPLIERLQIETEEVKRVAVETLSKVRRQMRNYCGDCPPLDLADETVILVDDGLSTGFTMLAAVRAVRRHEPARVVVAVAVGAFGALDRLTPQADDLVCLVERDDTDFAIAHAYRDFADLSDDQVRSFLQSAKTQRRP
jgi:putative phosphoribosyl transferase